MKSNNKEVQDDYRELQNDNKWMQNEHEETQNNYSKMLNDYKTTTGRHRTTINTKSHYKSGNLAADRVSGQRVPYAVESVKPPEAHCDLSYWDI